jgi:YesN/AraC family two-component response regulator
MLFQKEYSIQNMVCKRCIKVIKQELEKLNVTILSIDLGQLTLEIDTETNPNIVNKIQEVLISNGFEIVYKDEEATIEMIKAELIKLTDTLPIIIKEKISVVLSSKLHQDYNYLSKLFSKKEQLTIEKYLIKLKIEKAKELIQLQHYNFTEIAYLLDYSSVNHLSRQFKNIIGKSMTEYKKSASWNRSYYDEIM